MLTERMHVLESKDKNSRHVKEVVTGQGSLYVEDSFRLRIYKVDTHTLRMCILCLITYSLNVHLCLFD